MSELVRPKVSIVVVADRSASAKCDEGFIRVRRLTLKNQYEGHADSSEYPYDCVERTAMDAVGIVLYARASGSLDVCLRSSIRPPLALRPGYALPIPDRSGDPTLFEIPAGLVEEGEEGEEGLKACAARETMEEVGLDVEPHRFSRLGPATYLSPGLVAEKIHLFSAEVDPATATAPTMDGSPVEERATIRFVSLDEALAACRDGRLEDIKTEVALRRLREQHELGLLGDLGLVGEATGRDTMHGEIAGTKTDPGTPA
jgi:ADP-ribose pyrophosphatase